MTRGPCDRLDDIIERIHAATKAEDLLEVAEAQGHHDLAATITDAILYDLLIIGEAIKALPLALIESHSEVPWSLIARLRDRLAHHYFDIDLSLIRSTLDHPLRILSIACLELRDRHC